ncbi:hypothetical protein FKR81_37955 [Lentzea tibetensis]|uniref:Uncharacterized protein n=1 Tax=Lentzea tibetensis TaxID=2591470 RepID=A0A563EI63_9PSEU|nr:hypothetical protein [Lentzea tibetensis]TWP46006.1 hypothetical protein FKR81_37955 [Lentzea tibetensis]
MVEQIIVAVVAVSSASVALFRYLTVRQFVKAANKKDLPAIANAVFPRFQVGSRRPDLDAEQGDPRRTGEGASDDP